MYWHIEPSTFIVRGYQESVNGYAEKMPYDAVAHVKMLGEGRAFIEAAKGPEADLKPSEWRSLARLLRDEWGVHTLEAIRNGVLVSWPTGRAKN